MRKPLVAGNWKMNGSRADNAQLLSAVGQAAVEGLACDVLVCPPFLYLQQALDALAATPVAVGAQNVHERVSGAFTGEVSAPMLADLGIRYAIVGHSERRALYGESDAVVAAKFQAAQQAGLQPILCVGETLDQRESGDTAAVVARQLHAVCQSLGVEALAQAVLAYEPVWAIGTGLTATPQQAQEVHAFLRSEIARLDDTIANSVKILYGGSVSADNAAALFAMPDVDGGLVGGASLKAQAFVEICHATGRATE